VLPEPPDPSDPNPRPEPCETFELTVPVPTFGTADQIVEAFRAGLQHALKTHFGLAEDLHPLAADPTSTREWEGLADICDAGDYLVDGEMSAEQPGGAHVLSWEIDPNKPPRP